jgi:hypothetical protein
MNLRHKVIAASAAMLFTSTVGLGGLAIGITYQQGVSNVQAELEDLMELIETQEDPLAAALYEFDGLSVNVGYKLDDGSITMLQEVFVSSGPEEEISQVLDLGYGEVLIVSKSTKAIRDLVNQLLPIVLLSSLGFSVLSGLVLYGVLRRDVQGIRSLAKFAKDTTVTSSLRLVAVTGSAFSSTSDAIFKSFTSHFDGLKTLSDFKNGEEDFELSTERIAFSISNSVPFPYGPLSETININDAEPFFLDSRLTHLSNFDFLPPVNISYNKVKASFTIALRSTSFAMSNPAFLIILKAFTGSFVPPPFSFFSHFLE